jgi:hypothetical protein
VNVIQPTKSMFSCPHCDEPLPPEPDEWAWMPPWQCSHCGGLYGHGEDGTFRIDATVKPFHPLFSWVEALRFCYYAGNRHYVYLLCYPTGLPFYLGKGTGERVCQHNKNAFNDKYNKRGEKERIMCDLWNRHESEWYHFLALCDTAEEAWQIEQHWINKWGVRADSGLLCNLARANSQGAEFEELAPVDFSSIELTNERIGPREVYYPPELLARQPKNPRAIPMLCWCPVCNGDCLLNEELRMLMVQCPFCAHFFRPVSDARMRGSYNFNLATSNQTTSTAPE